ncbi:hypothetical protein [Streptomyces sp. NPDC091212]|uniref:hypothetical protein n=1 Tax=Streptomyces sp. NPDC091212 TaxID=3155191 RepID=UPI0034184A1C
MPVAPAAAVPPPVFGLSREWALADGSPVADALVLSHPEQLERLRAACPEAVPTAVVAGDPCFDRILAALPYRERFRRALDVRPGQRLVLLNSTWNPDSLFGDGGADDVLPTLLPRLTAELPADEYRVAAVLHPNIWHGHGPGQIRAWLDRARRGGLALVDPLESWRQALIAADVIIGDGGSVSYYGAALGTPVLLGAASAAGLDAASPVAAFVRQAPRLSPYAPLRTQLDALLPEGTGPGPGRPSPTGHEPGPTELVSSVPGEAAALLRHHFYRLIGIPEPGEPALFDPLPLPAYERTVRSAPMRVVTRLRETGEVEVGRYADPRSEPAADGDTHTAVHEDTLDPGRLALADVIVRDGAADDPRFGGPEQWTAEVLARHPHCALAAFLTDGGDCLVRTRGTDRRGGGGAGTLLRLCGPSPGADPAAYVSALYALLASGLRVADLAANGLTVRTGGRVHQVSVTPAVRPDSSLAPVTPPSR